MTTGLEMVTSADGTQIAVHRFGSGPAIILVGGAFNDHSSVEGLAAALSERATAIAYDRRGRGDSGDASAGRDAGSREREFDDLAAVIAAAGGRASLFGHSSGGVLVLEAAAARPDLGVDRLVVYEPAYVIEGTRASPGDDFGRRLRALLDAGRPDDAVALYQTEGIGLPTEVVDGMRRTDMWAWLTAIAPSLPYDAALYDPGFGPSRDRLAAIQAPTLVVAGTKTFDTLRAAARVVAEMVPGARLVELDGEDHGILRRPAALAALMADFIG